MTGNNEIFRKFLKLSNAEQFLPLKVEERLSPSKVKAIRTKFKLTQNDFATLIGVKYHTYKAWEIGHRAPSSPACAILTIADQFPENFISNREQIINYVKQNL